MPTIIKLTWNDSVQNQGYKVKWDDNPFIWSEVQVVLELAGLLSGGPTISTVNKRLNKDLKKKKRIITLICKVEGREYKEIKNIKDIKVTSEQIKLTLEEVLKNQIKVTIL